MCCLLCVSLSLTALELIPSAVRVLDIPRVGSVCGFGSVMFATSSGPQFEIDLWECLPTPPHVSHSSGYYGIR